MTICSNCSTGTFNANTSMTICQSCGAGTYNALIGQSVCQMCVPSLGFSNSAGQTYCKTRKLCSQGNYVNRTSDPTSYNMCVPCMLCGDTEMAILDQPFMDPSNWTGAIIDIDMCPGIALINLLFLLLVFAFGFAFAFFVCSLLVLLLSFCVFRFWLCFCLFRFLAFAFFVSFAFD